MRWTQEGIEERGTRGGWPGVDGRWGGGELEGGGRRRGRVDDWWHSGKRRRWGHEEGQLS